MLSSGDIIFNLGILCILFFVVMGVVSTFSKIKDRQHKTDIQEKEQECLDWLKDTSINMTKIKWEFYGFSHVNGKTYGDFWVMVSTEEEQEWIYNFKNSLPKGVNLRLVLE